MKHLSLLALLVALGACTATKPARALPAQSQTRPAGEVSRKPVSNPPRARKQLEADVDSYLRTLDAGPRSPLTFATAIELSGWQAQGSQPDQESQGPTASLFGLAVGKTLSADAAKPGADSSGAQPPNRPDSRSLACLSWLLSTGT